VDWGLAACYYSWMRRALLLFVFAASSTGAQNWVRLSDTDQGLRFVDLHSATRQGHHAAIDTELRMKPAIKRREHFDCSKRLMLSDTYTVLNVHEPKLTFSGQEWAPVLEGGDSAVMLKLACGRQPRKKP
jgi:hypothetical protein